MSLAILMTYRHQIANDFSFLSGDRYDSVIVVTILEHWFNVFMGKESWSNVLYFYPYGRTIAQTDAYFLVGLLYFPFRILGEDPFLSFELAGVLLKIGGFLSMFLFCRKSLKLPFLFSCAAAILFTVNNGMTVHSSRLQLATVAFAPLMAYLLHEALQAFLKGFWLKFSTFGALSGILFGAWCMSCFYMAWFFGFYILVFLIASAFLVNSEFFRRTVHRVREGWIALLFVFLAWCISLTPFIWAFLPKSREVGVRSYESVFANTVPIEGVLQVGKENILSGGFYNYLLSIVSPDYAPASEYYNTGFSVPLFVLFILSVVSVLKSLRSRQRNLVVDAGIIAVCLTWISILKFGGFSLWSFVYYVVPGAKALNVISAYQIFLAFPVAASVAVYISKRDWNVVSTTALFSILIAFEVNNPYLNLDRKSELTRISSVQRSVPRRCEAFYVSGWEGQDGIIPNYPNWINNFYAHNVSAMLIAQLVGIPTVNGIASFNPPDWNFGYPNNGDYENRVLSYASKHNVHNLCKLDLNTKVWSSTTEAAPLSVGERISFTIGDSGLKYLAGGWSYPEKWGTWSLGNVSKIKVPVNSPVPNSIVIEGHPLVRDSHPLQKVVVKVNGQNAALLDLRSEQNQKLYIPLDKIEFDRRSPSQLLVEFSFPDSISSLNLGINRDDRVLAFQLISLELR